MSNQVEAASNWNTVESTTSSLQHSFGSVSYVYIESGPYFFGYGNTISGANWSLTNIPEDLLNLDYTNYNWRLRVVGYYNGQSVERILNFTKQDVLDFYTNHNSMYYGVGPVGPFDQGGSIKTIYLEKSLKNQNPIISIGTSTNQPLSERITPISLFFFR